jgi:hypothetical protein
MGNKLLNKQQKSIELISNYLREIRFNENLTNKNVQELTGLTPYFLDTFFKKV